MHRQSGYLKARLLLPARKGRNTLIHGLKIIHFIRRKRESLPLSLRRSPEILGALSLSLVIAKDAQVSGVKHTVKSSDIRKPLINLIRKRLIRINRSLDIARSSEMPIERDSFSP